MTFLDFFAPCRNGRDRGVLGENRSEVQLIEDRTEEFLRSDDLTWEDILQLLNLHDWVWFSRDVLIFAKDDGSFPTFPDVPNRTMHRLEIESEHQQAPQSIHLASLTDHEPTRFYEKIVGLMAQERPIAMTFVGGFPLSAGSLSHFLDRNSGNLKWLAFRAVRLSPEHCRTIGAFEGYLSLHGCGLYGSETFLLSEIEKSRGPKGLKLDLTRIVNARALYDALSSSRSLREFSLSTFGFPRNIGIPQLLNAAGQNIGLVDFHLRTTVTSATEWEDAFRSLLLHPTLQKIDIRFHVIVDEEEDMNQAMVRRAEIVEGALKRNEVLQALDFRDVFGNKLLDETIFDERIKPLLIANDYRSRLKALAKTETDTSLRLAVFSRALMRPIINTNASLVWTLLSGFQDHLVTMLKTRSESDETAEEESETQSRNKKLWTDNEH